MRSILVISQFYWPDVASTANLYTQLCEYLSRDFDVTVLSAVPSYLGMVPDGYKDKKVYKNTENGVRVIRVRVSEFDKQNKKSRVRSLFGYLFRTAKVIHQVGKFDIVLTVSQPPILGGLLGWYASKKCRAKLVYNIQDFNPEQIIYTGYSHRRWLIKLLQTLDNAVCRHADAVILPSEDMNRTLFERLQHRRVPRSYVISNWVDTTKIVPVKRDNNPLISKYGLNEKDFLVVYAGNVGIMQSLQTLVNAAEQLQEYTDIRFIVIGEGAWSDAMLQMINEKHLSNIQVFPYEPTENIKYVYSLGDIEIVSIGKNVTKCSMPSKTWNILACGRPVICQVDADSELNRLIQKERIGYSIKPDDFMGMAKNILELYHKNGFCQTIGENARKLATQQYDAQISLKRYEDVLQNLIST